jgi:predicted deacylase
MVGSVTVVPVGNPVAFAQGTRNTPDESDAPDLNRCFPGVHTWVTEQLAKAITRNVLQETDYLIDFHLGLWGATMGMVGYGGDFSDSRVRSSARDLALSFGYPLVREMNLVTKFPGPGSACGYAGEALGIPNMVVEIGGAGFGDELEELWIEQVLSGLRNVARFLGILPGEPVIAQEPYLINSSCRVNSSVGGYLLPDVKPDQLTMPVHKGKTLGRVVSPYTFEILEVLEAPVDGRLFMIPRAYPVRPGYWAFCIGYRS